jgi:hypothetical protein
MWMYAPEKVVRQLFLRRLFEAGRDATLRIHAGQNVADYSVLARGVESLQDNEKGVLVLGVHPEL